MEEVASSQVKHELRVYRKVFWHTEGRGIILSIVCEPLTKFDKCPIYPVLDVADGLRVGFAHRHSGDKDGGNLLIKRGCQKLQIISCPAAQALAESKGKEANSLSGYSCDAKHRSPRCRSVGCEQLDYGARPSLLWLLWVLSAWRYKERGIFTVFAISKYRAKEVEGLIEHSFQQLVPPMPILFSCFVI